MERIQSNIEGQRLTALRWIALAGLSVFVFWLIRLVFFETSTFDSDEADHANAALELYHALGSLSLSTIYESIVRQVFYPPLHSFLVAPFYFIFGPSHFSSRIPSVLIYVLSAFLIYSSLLRAFPGKRDESLFAATLVILCPMAVYNGVLCMLEPVGLLLVGVMLHLFIGFERSKRYSRIGFAVTLIAVVLTKYNFAVILFASVGSVFLVQLIYRKVEFRELLVLALMTLLPIAGWFMIVEWDCIRSFIEDQPAHSFGVWSLKNTLYYPKIFLLNHVSHPAIGILSAFLALCGAWSYRERPVVQFAASTVFWSLAVLFFTTHNGSRHFLLASSSIWFLSGCGLISLFEYSRLVKKKTLVASLLFIFVWVASIPWFGELPSILVKRFEGKPHLAVLTDQILDRVGDNSPVLVRGATDQFSLEGLRFSVAKRFDVPYSEVKLDGFPVKISRPQRCRRREGKVALDPAIPEKPLSAILDARYYDYFVDLLSPRRQKKLKRIEASGKFLQKFPREELQQKQRKAIVYKLR